MITQNALGNFFSQIIFGKVIITIKLVKKYIACITFDIHL